MGLVTHLPRLHSGASATALAAALLLAAPARAAQPCGPIVDDQVTCDIEEGPFDDGMYYKARGDFTLNLADGLTVAPLAGGDYNSGVEVYTAFGSVVINGAGADIATVDRGALAVFASGDIEVALDDVSTSGWGSYGSTSYTFDGTTDLSFDSVSTDGDYSLGIVAESTLGDIAVDVGSVTTRGLAADAITVRTGGDVDIAAGSIVGQGDYLWGVHAQSANVVDEQMVGGQIAVDVGSIAIGGDHAVGVLASSYGGIDIDVDRIEIGGQYGTGVIAIGADNVSVKVDEAMFAGTNTGGIIAFSYAEADVEVGRLHASHGGGVVSFGVMGASARAGEIVTNGDYGNGIQAVSSYGDATLEVASVKTNGFFATAVNVDALMGHAAIKVGTIDTKGDLAMGVRAFGRTSRIDVSGSIRTDGDTAFGLLNATTRGDAVVRTQGSISTSGYYADGMWVTGRYGTADIVASGAITTTGDNSRGIQAIGEDGQVRIVADAVSTMGAGSSGIEARTRYVELFMGQSPVPDIVPFSGDIDIRALDVRATGQGSHAVSAKGLGKASLDIDTALSQSGHAIETDMIEDSAIVVRKVARSAEASAIDAAGQNVAIEIRSGALVSGAIDGVVIRALGDRCTMRNAPDGSPNPCPNPGGQWDVPDPSGPVPPAGTASLVNDGTIVGAGGYAVKVERGTLTLDNRGTIDGALKLHDGHDLVTNRGTLLLARDSDFGAGNDRLDNRATLGLSERFAPAFVRLGGLELLANQGLVTLANGIAGDTLEVAGDYAASGEARLRLDASIAGGRVDQLRIAGAASGTTRIELAMNAADARLTGDRQLVLVDAGDATAANAFVLADDGREAGFVRYGLRHDGAGRFLLESVAGSGAYRQLAALDGAADAWNLTAGLVGRQLAAERDLARGGDAAAGTSGHALWGSLHGEHARRDLDAVIGTSAEPDDLSYGRDSKGAQLGYTLRLGGAGGARVGMTGGALWSDLDSLHSNDKARLTTLNLGAYAALTSGAWFANLIAKADWHKLRLDAATTGFSGRTDGSSIGVALEAGTRIGGDSGFVEPVAGLAFARTDLDDLGALGQRLEFATADGVRGRLGARFGGERALAGGKRLALSGALHAVSDFGADTALTLVSGGERERLTSARSSAFAEAQARASLRSRGLETYLETRGELGTDHRSIGVAAGAVLRF